jgi:hypothetical protein
MTRRNLPPLEVDTTYRARDFEGFEFSARILHKAVTGEDTAILRLLLANRTILEIPTSEDDLHRLLRNLMEAYPSVAKEHAKVRGWT